MPAAPAALIDPIVLQLRRAAAALPERGHGNLAALARACMRTVGAVADEWVATSRAAKGWTRVAANAAEEWASGPLPVARLLRLLAQRHDHLAQDLPFGPRPRPGLGDGAREFDLLPAAGLGDALLLRGYRARLCADAGTRPTPAAAGDVAVVLGAGNVTATPLLDALDQVLLRGRAVLVKVSPLHAALLPVFERALAPLIEAGLVRCLAGDAALGARLAGHSGVAAVHLTGSVTTAANLRADPHLAGKVLTAELGCNTPAFVLPGAWRPRELDHVATQLAAFVAWNGGATCLAPRVLVTARDWPQRDAFLQRVRARLAALPARVPFHPATRADYAAAGAPLPADERLPPVLLAEFDVERDAARLQREHFAPVLFELPLAGTADAWLARATATVRDRVAGALSAYVFAPPRALAAHAAALPRAIAQLPHGTIAINTWTGLGYGLGSAPWGVSADAPWQHGIGQVHHLFPERHVRRVVLEAPFRTWPPPPWLPGRRGSAAALRALTRHYVSPSLLHLGAVACHAVR